MSETDYGALMRDAGQAGPRAVTRELAACEKAARAAGFAVHQADLARVVAKASLLSTLARALKLPSHFGGNWDALEECLLDPEWLAAPGCCIVLTHCGRYAEAQPDEFSTLIDVCDSVARVWREEDRPFWVLFSGAPAAGFGLAAPGAE